MKHVIFSAAGLLALTACSDPGDPVFSSFRSEAGAVADNGNFGNAQMQNLSAMTNRDRFIIDLSNRFSADVDPTVTFAFNSAVLDGAAMETLREQAKWIRQFPGIRFRVYGHTDLVGSDSYNKALGLRRANAVVNYLVGQGVERGLLEAVVSFGEEQPLIVTQGRERRNRRTVTEVSGVAENHPATLDGRYARAIYQGYIRSAEYQTMLSGIEGSDFATEE